VFFKAFHYLQFGFVIFFFGKRITAKKLPENIGETDPSVASSKVISKLTYKVVKLCQTFFKG